MAEPIQIAVVGHTNTGKTSLLRTLARRHDFGEVSSQPGTTRHVQSVSLKLKDKLAVTYWDTPGLEDSVSLEQYLNLLRTGDLSPAGWIAKFLAGPEAKNAYEQEAKVLRTLSKVDVVVYVIDCREPVLPKYVAEMRVLTATGKPIMPVLNFVRSPETRESKWREALAANGLHFVVKFDAVAPFMGSERMLYEFLAVVLQQRSAQLKEILAELNQQVRLRREASCRVIAGFLLSVTAMRREISKTALADPDVRNHMVAQFRSDVIKHVRGCVEGVLAVYAFRREDADVSIMQWTTGRWEHDIFNPEQIAATTKLIGKGAIVGAVVGATVDLALAGVTLGAAASIGAFIGGLASQGFGHLPRKLKNLAMGIEELSLEDAVIVILIDNLQRFCRAMEERGHASLQRVQVELNEKGQDAEYLAGIFGVLLRARANADWEQGSAQWQVDDLTRQSAMNELATLLLNAPSFSGDA